MIFFSSTFLVYIYSDNWCKLMYLGSQNYYLMQHSLLYKINVIHRILHLKLLPAILTRLLIYIFTFSTKKSEIMAQFQIQVKKPSLLLIFVLHTMHNELKLRRTNLLGRKINVSKNRWDKQNSFFYVLAHCAAQETKTLILHSIFAAHLL